MYCPLTAAGGRRQSCGGEGEEHGSSPADAIGPFARRSSLRLRHSRGSECAVVCSDGELPLRSGTPRSLNSSTRNTRDTAIMMGTNYGFIRTWGLFCPKSGQVQIIKAERYIKYCIKRVDSTVLQPLLI